MTNRTVFVGLKMDIADYVRGAKTSERVTDDLREEVNGLRGDMQNLGTKTTLAATDMIKAKPPLESLGNKAIQASNAVDRLGDELGEARRKVRELGEEIRREGATPDLLEKFGASKAKLAQLEAVGKELDRLRGKVHKTKEEINRSRKEISAAGPLFGDLFGKAIGSPLSLGIGAAVAVNAPFIAAAIGGAVTAGLGMAAVGAGLVGAFQDERVKDAAENLGGEIARDFIAAGSSFEGPALRGMEKVRAAWRSGLRQDMQETIESAAKFVDPLATAGIRFTQNVAGGVKELVQQSGPAIDAIADKLPDIGQAIGKSFKDLGSNSEAAGTGLRRALFLTELTVSATGDLLNSLIEVYGLYSKIDWSVFGLLSKMDDDRIVHHIKRVGDTATQSFGAAVDKVKELADAFDELNGDAIGWAKAEIQMEEAIDNATKAIGRKREGLNAETEAGRRNREALLSIVDTTQKAVEQKYKETQSVEAAKRVYDEGRQALIRTAMQAGATRQQAEALANQWLRMPKMISTTISTPGIDAAISKIRQLKVETAGIPKYRETVYRVTGTQHRLMREGGAVIHAREGYLREPAIYSSRSPARYAFAEPATGGELFLPRNGDQKRGRDLLGVGASWYKMGMVPLEQMHPSSSGGGTSVQISTRRRDSFDEFLLRQLRVIIRDRGGDPIQVLTPG